MSAKDKARILLVDDAKVQRLVVETKLREMGYEVAGAGDGREALEILAQNQGEEGSAFDLIILDVMMPEIDGITVLKRLRESHSPIQLPVIMATGKDDAKDVVEGLQAGANDYVTKPYDMAILLARLETQLALKDSHEALRSAQRSLIHAAKMESIGHLAAGVAHEIRNPLAQIQMAAEALKTRFASPGDEEVEFLFSMIVDNVKKSDEIVLDLMRFSESSQLQLVPGDVPKLLQDSIDMVEQDARAAGIALKVEIDEPLPEVKFAENEMRQILVGLLQNSIQAMPNGGHIHVLAIEEVLEGLPADEGSRTGNRPRNGDRVVSFVVEDDGPGIPEDSINNVFDAFYTTKATGDATGLGLTIARRVIDLHRGLITVANRTDDASGVRATISLRAGTAFQTAV